MFKSTRQYDGSYLITHTDDVRFGRLIVKTSEGWKVLSDITRVDIYERFVPFRTKQAALFAIKCDY